MRVAEVLSKDSPSEQVAAYLPSNYDVFELSDGRLVIVGNDDSGWTMNEYVLPRLASGLHIAAELEPVR